MGNWFNAGRIRPVAKGEWSSAVNYTALDYVIAPNGSRTYIATKDVPVGTPLDNADYWQVLVDAASLEKRAADRLASPFAETGSMVTCHPVEDYPLEVNTIIEPVQAGSGDPAPDNIRAITGVDSATLTHNGNAFAVDFGQNVYGGKFDWNTGLLTIDRKMVIFNGTESFSMMSDMTNQTKSNIFFYKQTDAAKVGLMSSVCSHFKNTNDTVWSTVFDGRTGIYCDNLASSGNYNNKYFRWGNGSNTLADWKAFLAAQYAAGTPVQLCYKIAEPITIQLTPHQILALKGTNTLYSDVGNTSVTGRIAPEWLNEQLRNAIIALGGNV